MNRIFPLSASVFLIGTAEAHVSHAAGMAHAFEHLWILLALVPAVLLLAPLLRPLLKKIKP